MRATLQSPLSNLVVKDRVALGLKVMENNRDVTYAGEDGKPISFRTNDGLIDGLIQHAGNRAIPAHLTHEWTKGEKDPLSYRVGAFKNFRKDESGALLADFHAMPGVDGDKMLWLAEHDPENAALSTVFDWNRIKSGEITYAYPLSFDAADFVAKGAACARLAEFKPTDTDMTKEEIQALIDAGVAAKLKDFKPEGYITEAESDKRIKAALSAFKPDAIAIDDKTKAEMETEIEAKLVAKLGGGPLLLNLKKEGEAKDSYTAKLAEYRKTSKSEGAAVARLLNDHPELTPQREAHLQAEMAKLANV